MPYYRIQKPYIYVGKYWPIRLFTFHRIASYTVPMKRFAQLNTIHTHTYHFTDTLNSTVYSIVQYSTQYSTLTANNCKGANKGMHILVQSLFVKQLVIFSFSKTVEDAVMFLTVPLDEVCNSVNFITIQYKNKYCMCTTNEDVGRI